MACAITTQWGNHVYWTPPDRDDISHYLLHRRSDEVDPVNTADVVAHVPFAIGSAASPHFFDPFTAVNTAPAFTYWVQSVAWDGQVSLLSGKITAIASPTALQTSFITNGTAVLSNLTICNALTVCGASTLTGIVSVGNTLHVCGAVTFGSTLNVSGAISISNTLFVCGTTTLNGLTVSGIATIGTLNVTGAASIQTTLHVSGAVTFGSSLNVSGAASISSTLWVCGSTTLNGLTVSGTATIGTLDVTANLSVSGTFHVCGAATFSSTVTINGTAIHNAASNITTSDPESYFSSAETEGTIQEIVYRWQDAFEPTGFENAFDSTISFNTGTLTFSISPTITNFTYYIKGERFLKCAVETVVIDNSTGFTLIYYDSSTLSKQKDPTSGFVSCAIRTFAIVSGIYYSTADASAIYFGEERHGITMDGSTHAYLHFINGLAYATGLGLSDITADQSGDLDPHAQFGVEAGGVADEDIYVNIDTVASTTGLPIWYREGAAGNWRKTVNPGFSVVTASAGVRLVYNRLNAGVWDLFEVTSNNYVLCHVFASTEINDPVFSVMGQAQYSSLALARTGAETEINNLLLGDLPLPEIRPIATVIFQTVTGYANDAAARIRTLADGSTYIDWRTTSLGRGAAATDHGSLAGLGDDDHQQYLILSGRGGQTIDDNIITCGTLTINDSAAINANLSVTGYITVGQYIGLTSTTTLVVTAPGSGIKLFGKDSGGLTKLMYVDSAGTEYQVPGAAGGNVVYVEAENSAAVDNGAADMFLVFDTASFTIAVNGQCATITTIGGAGNVVYIEEGATAVTDNAASGLYINFTSDQFDVVTATGTSVSITLADPLMVGSLNVTASLSVQTTMHVSGAVTFGSSLNVSGAVSVSNTLFVCGTTTLNGATISGTASIQTLNVTANASVQGTLWVSGSATFNGITNSGTLTTGYIGITANASVGGTLWVCGSTTLNGATISGTLTVSTLNVTANASVQGTLWVSGATTLNILTVSGATNITGNICGTGTLYIAGESTLSALNTVNISGAGTLYVAGASTLSAVNTVNISSSGTLYVAGSTTISALNSVNISSSGTLYVAGASTISALNSVNISSSGTLYIAGASTISALNTSGNVCANGTLVVSGATTLCSSLTVAGTAIIEGTTTINDNAVISGTLTVYGGTTLQNLSVTGGATVVGTLKACGIVTFSSDLIVSGSTTVGSGLFTKLYIEFTSNTTISVTAPSAGIRLFGKASGTLTKLMTVDSAGTEVQLGAGGGAGNAIYICESATAHLDTTADVVHLNFSNEHFNVAVNGRCATVTNIGAVTFTASGAVVFGSTLVVCGTSTLVGSVTTCGNLTVSGILSVAGAATFSSTVTISGAVSLSSTLQVASTTHIKSNAAIGNTSVLSYNNANLAVQHLDTNVVGGYGIWCEAKFQPASQCDFECTGIGGFSVILNTNFSALSQVCGLSFSPYIGAASVGSTALDTFGVRTHALRGFSGTAYVKNSYGLYASGYRADFPNVRITGNASYGVYIANNDVHTGGWSAQYGLYIEELSRETTNFQMVMGGSGTAAQGIWFNGTTGPHIGGVGTGTNAVTYISNMTVCSAANDYVMWDTVSHTLHYCAVTSARRFKTDIRDFNDSWNLILNVQPKKFKKIKNGVEEIGYIAEDIEDIGLEDLITRLPDGQIKGLKYNKFILYAIEAMKEQNNRIKMLEDEVTKMAKTINLMANKIIGDK